MPELEVIRYTGHSSKRRNLLFLGDGFTAAQADFFRTFTTLVADKFFSYLPFPYLQAHTNVFRCFTPQQVEGVGAANDHTYVVEVGSQQTLRTDPLDLPPGGRIIGRLPWIDSALGVVEVLFIEKGLRTILQFAPGSGVGAIGAINAPRRIDLTIAGLTLPETVAHQEGVDTFLPDCWALEGRDSGLVVVLVNSNMQGGNTAAPYVTVSIGTANTFGVEPQPQNPSSPIVLTPSGTRQHPLAYNGFAARIGGIVAHELGHSVAYLVNESGDEKGVSYNARTPPVLPITGMPTFDIAMAKKNDLWETWNELIHERVRKWMSDQNTALYSVERARADQANINWMLQVNEPQADPSTDAASLDDLLRGIKITHRVVGLYAGLGPTLSNYRPTGDCVMRGSAYNESPGTSPFCIVCCVALVRRYLEFDQLSAIKIVERLRIDHAKHFEPKKR